MLLFYLNFASRQNALFVGIFSDILINGILMLARKNIVFKGIDGASDETGESEFPHSGPSVRHRGLLAHFLSRAGSFHLTRNHAVCECGRVDHTMRAVVTPPAVYTLQYGAESPSHRVEATFRSGGVLTMASRNSGAVPPYVSI